MDTETSSERQERRFACTRCGACCNRSPEVELSEAAALADLFVFRLMFRIYDLPRSYAGSSAAGGGGGASALFYERKRLLAAFAARKAPVKRLVGGRAIDHVRYLTISALTLDAGTGACSALAGGLCGIYARRPLACRAVPFHYSRAEAGAAADLDRFVATPGYGCDTSAAAPVVVAEGRVVDPGAQAARREALALAESDSRWREAIVRRMKAQESDGALPSLRQVEADAARGATTVSMRVAWQIAAEAGLMSAGECRALVAAQAAAIERALLGGRCGPEARETLAGMRGEYRQLLNG